MANGNGNNLIEINPNELYNLKRVSISFFSRLFNILPSQWGRVTECWLISFFFKVGSVVGWTVLTAAFISRFGIKFLPILFVLNASLIVLSTIFFEKLIMRVKREVLMIQMLLFGAICLFMASFFYDRSPMAFFTLVIFAESVFLAQFNVFIPILVGDRFTPLESQKTFPFVESGENIGGALGGIVVGIFGARFATPWFLYIWIVMLALVIFVFVLASYARRTSLPPMEFRAKPESERLKTTDQLRLVFKSIKQIPFLKGLVIIVLLQWVFMNVLEFQYTKAMEQSVTNRQEDTVAVVESKTMQTAVLGIEDTKIVDNEASSDRSLTVGEEALLTTTLGTWKSIFHIAALIVQVLLASRLITSLGIIGSMLLHPIVMLMSLVGMFLKFGFLSSVIAKVNFESTLVIHKNAYFSSQYAFPKVVRDQAAEFLEGIVRPMGTIVGMVILMFFQTLFAGRDLSLWIYGMMFVIMAAILVNTMRLQKRYTSITKSQLFSNLPYPEKLNAIEILAQRGHEDSHLILVQKLKESGEEPPVVRVKLLAALGRFRNYSTLPGILDALYDINPDVRLEAANALMNFHDIGDRFYHQAFSRYRMVEILKEVFVNEKSASVRSAIIRLFSLMKQADTIAFLLDSLKNQSDDVRADCIYTVGLFRDPSAAHYILPFLDNPNPRIVANAIIALWQFPIYRAGLEKRLDSMLKNPDMECIKAGVFAAGEINFSRKRILNDLLNSKDPDVQIEAAFALTKAGHAGAFEVLLDHFLSASAERFESLRRFFNRLSLKARHMVNQILIHYVSQHLDVMMNKCGDKLLHEMDRRMLENLRRLYTLLDQHEELYEVEEAMKRHSAEA
ncbi:HEAT repeat domain-containing protein [Candidatus Peregrinibacteria bacterium]|nr:HEAT repeat domain-containing protein [Candidatus Peregrinibacteria bacterium]